MMLILSLTSWTVSIINYAFILGVFFGLFGQGLFFSRKYFFQDGPRTMVGIATFDCTIHFYNLRRASQQVYNQDLPRSTWSVQCFFLRYSCKLKKSMLFIIWYCLFFFFIPYLFFLGLQSSSAKNYVLNEFFSKRKQCDENVWELECIIMYFPPPKYNFLLKGHWLIEPDFVETLMLLSDVSPMLKCSIVSRLKSSSCPI